MNRHFIRRRVALAFTALAILLLPAVAGAAERSSVIGTGRVVIDKSNPYLGGTSYEFAIAAYAGAGGKALGGMTIMQRDPNSSRSLLRGLRVDCLRIKGRTAILSAKTLREQDENGPVTDELGFRVAVKITDGARDQLVFGHGPPSAPNCSARVFDGVPMMPVLHGSFRVR